MAKSGNPVQIGTRVQGDVSTLTILSGISSIITIGKAGAEKLLTFGRVNINQDASFLEKLKMLALYSPVFILTSLFRIGSLAVVQSGIVRLFIAVEVPLLFGLPLLFLLT